MITEKRISYSAGMKVNMGNYQSVDLHMSESETLDVSQLTTGAGIEAYVAGRYASLKETVDNRLKEALAELKGA